MIHNLKLNNFKQHQALEIEFTQGLNVIQGDNGAGKSTILKAILYALFGANAAGKKEHLATWGSNDKMEVSLTATIAGKTLVIFRGFDKATIHHGDDLLAAGHTPCTKFIEQELGLDYKTFKHLLYAAQGETQVLLKIGAADLQRKIEVITKIDGIDKVVGLIAEDLQTLAGKLSVVPEIGNLKQLEEELQELKTAEANKVSFIAELGNMATQVQIKLEGRMEELKNVIAPAIQKAREAKAAQKALTASLSNIEADLESHDKIKPTTCSKVLQAEQESLVDYIKKSQLKLNKAASATKDLMKMAQDVDSSEEELYTFESLSPLFTHRNALWSNLKLTETDYTSLVKQYADLIQVEADCPSCGRAFDEEVSLRHNIKVLLLKEEVDNSKKQFEIASGVWSGFKIENPAVLDVDFSLTHEKLSDNLVVLLTRYGNAKFNPDLMETTTYNELIVAVNEAALTQEINANKVKVAQRWEQAQDSLISQLVRVKQSLESLDTSECAWTDQALTSAEEEVALFQKTYQERLDTLTSNSFELKELRTNHETKLKEFLSAQRGDKHRKELEIAQALRKELQTYLRANRARLLSDTWGNITNLTGAYTNDITAGLLNSLSRDTSGDFTITEGGNSVPVSELSGGRQSIVGLALRMALGQTFFGGNSFLLLDEISSDLTDENAASVAGFLSGLGTQVIMVSHRSGEASNACNVIVL